MSDDSLGNRVKSARLARGLSQSQVAAAVARGTGAKTTKSLISQWECGRVFDPKLSTIYELHRVLGVSLPWLLTGKEDGAENKEQISRLLQTPNDEDRLKRSIELAMSLRLRNSATSARAALLFFKAISSNDQIDDSVLLALARFSAESP